jgi:hypothetical protein
MEAGAGKESQKVLLQLFEAFVLGILTVFTDFMYIHLICRNSRGFVQTSKPDGSMKHFYKASHHLTMQMVMLKEAATQQNKHF